MEDVYFELFEITSAFRNHLAGEILSQKRVRVKNSPSITVNTKEGESPEMEVADEIKTSSVVKESVEKLEKLKSQVLKCKKCPLYQTRTNVVFGEGGFEKGVVFVGEAPGAEEDKQGRPFVGRAGKLLDKLLSEIGFSRKDVYICNVLKCRPPNNRDPKLEEIRACYPYLSAQIEIIKPKLIVALGRHAMVVLAGIDGITKNRGKILNYRGYPVMPTFHPAAVLRNPRYMSAVREDFRKIKQIAESR